MLDGWRRRIADPHLPRTLAGQLEDAGLEVAHREVFAIFDPIGDKQSYSAHQIEHLGASATGVPDQEIEQWATDLRSLAHQGNYFFSINRYIFLATRPWRQGYNTDRARPQAHRGDLAHAEPQPTLHHRQAARFV